jgi:hypothetical protein
LEQEQRKNDTVYGYVQGYDAGVEGKEPITPKIINI